MKTTKRSALTAPIAALLSLLAGSLPLLAIEQVQTISLQPGWNAVWLEVSPLDAEGKPATIESVFDSPSITRIASPIRSVGTTEFISDPSVTFNQDSWAVWHQGSLTGNSVTRVRGNQAYLVKASAPVTLTITGEVRFFSPTWSAGNYNLLGFGLSGNPTFGEFFGSFGSPGGVHPISKIFALDPDTGHWGGVQSTDPMSGGTAYWIFAERNSNFMGPVSVAFDGSSSLGFGDGPGTIEVEDSSANSFRVNIKELTLTNAEASGHTVRLEKLFPATSGTAAQADELRLFNVVPVPDTLSRTLSPGTPISDFNVGVVAAGTTETVSLGAHRNWSSGLSRRENLYEIHVSLGGGSAYQYFRLPVGASRSDLPDGTLGASDPDYTGLWVGEARLETVTSFAAEGSPLEPTTSTLPISVIIHLDESGTPSLLSQVLFMQTKTANEDVPPVPVLVVNEEKIPFFEGIEERNGHLVGRRVETSSYDMPQILDPSSSSLNDATLDAIAAALSLPDPSVTPLTAGDLLRYLELESTSSRPTWLAESYEKSWPLEGGLGPGSIVRTTAPLVLNPFHRSNPFRHAYHPNHGRGLSVARSISITFDATKADGLLQGSYTESIEGLTARATPITLSGPLTLRRISPIGTLE